jgi:hypothetical protein
VHKIPTLPAVRVLSFQDIATALGNGAISISELIEHGFATACLKALSKNGSPGQTGFPMAECITVAECCRRGLAAVHVGDATTEYHPAAFCEFVNETVLLTMTRTDLHGADGEARVCATKRWFPLAFVIAETPFEKGACLGPLPGWNRFRMDEERRTCSSGTGSG